MANNNSLAALSTEKLTKRRDLIKSVLISFSMMWLLLLCLATYFLVTKSTAKLFMPLAAFPITLLPLFLQLKPLNTEIKNRGKKNEPNQ